MMVYKYSLHDPDSGKVLYEGTAADLAAQGVVVSEKVLPTLWRDQQRKTENAQAKPPRRPTKPKGAAVLTLKPAAPRKPRVRLKKYLADPDPLQLDVRDLEGYNAQAREHGKKELSYGYWAAEGKPAAPAW